MANPATTLGLHDGSGQPRPETWADLLEAKKRVNAFVRSLGARFLGRDTLLEKLMYALCMGEHLLISGPKGTGKTGLVEATIGNITGAVTWSTDLSRGMSEAHLFGDYDAKLAQEEGTIMHRTKGSLLEAHFLNLGEFFDASTPLLRTLLRVLHERQFHRGPQRLKVPLMTAIGNTNAVLAELLARDTNDTLGAVIDRFLFHEPVLYLAAPDDRLEILRQRAGIKSPPPVVPVRLQDIELMVEAIRQLNFVVEDSVLRAYEEITRLFGKERGRPISDRRLLKGVDLLEAVAILRGSVEGATFSDLPRVGLMLVDDPNDLAKFETIVRHVVEHAQDASAHEVVEGETSTVDLIMASVATFRAEDLEFLPEADLLKLHREVRKATTALQGYVPTTQTGKDFRKAKLATLSEAARLIQRQIDAVGSGP